MKLIPSLLIAITILVGVCTASTTYPVAEMTASTQKGFWQSWTAPVNISQSPLQDPKATWPTIDVDETGGLIYIAWSDQRKTVQDIYYAVSVDRGWNWSAAEPIAETDANSSRPSLVVADTLPLIAWAEQSGLWTYTTYQWTLDTGEIVEVPNDRDWLATTSRLALGSDGEVHLALQGGSDAKPDILYNHRDLEATEWPSATVVFTTTAGGSHNPALGVSNDGQNAHIVWQENFTTSESEIYYLRGQREGQEMIWETALSLSESITRSMRPAIWVGPEIIHVAWGEYGNVVNNKKQQHVRYTQSRDGGTTWSSPLRINSVPVHANDVAPTDVAPALAVTPSGAICVAWHGILEGANKENEEIYLICSTDEGATWSTPNNVSSTPDIISIRPVMDVGNDGILHMAWQEMKGTNPIDEYQIYYAHSLPYTVQLPVVMRGQR